MGANNALGTGVVSFGDNNSWLDLAGYNASIRGLESGSFTGISVKNSASTTSTLTLGAGTTAADSYTYAGTLASNINIEKVGAGTQTFRDSHGGGNLAVVGGVAVLSGTNTLNTLTTEASGTLRSVGTSNIANLTIDGIWEEVIKSTSDFGQIATDNIEFNPDTKLNLILDDYMLKGYDSFVILTADTKFAMSDASLPSDFDWESILSDNYYWNLNYIANGDGGKLVLSVDPNAVPEPATWVMLIIGVSALVLGRRKRQK